MCTAATYKTKDFYFGRTLDYEFSYGDEITVTPRNYPFEFRYMGRKDNHYAMIGMAHVAGGYPLYYDAINEKGLGMAGLNFVGNAVYQEADESGERDNVAQYEFIPWILGSCASVGEARVALDRMNLTGTPFSEQLPTAQLHWIIADRNGAITVECMADGLHVYENPGWGSHEQPAISSADVPAQSVYGAVTKAAGEHVCTRGGTCHLQPWHGGHRTSGRPVIHVEICPGGICKTEQYVRGFRG